MWDTCREFAVEMWAEGPFMWAEGPFMWAGGPLHVGQRPRSKIQMDDSAGNHRAISRSADSTESLP